MSFSARGSIHAARSVDEMVAAEWSLEDLRVVELYPEMGSRAERELAEAARARAEAEARQEQERVVKEAHARGVEEGRREGEQAEGNRLKNALRATEQALADLRENEERWLASIEENICALSVAIARQIIDHELHMEPGAVENLVRRALGEFPVDQTVRIRLHPRDLAVIESRSPQQRLPATLEGRETQWLPDANLVQGGCVVEGRDRIIDGRIDTALERVYRRLTYASA
ncbi:MAG TPA: FliH/SctL family protein [Longimicrobiaceae bacterium]